MNKDLNGLDSKLKKRILKKSNIDKIINKTS